MKNKISLALWFLPVLLLAATANPAEDRENLKSQEPMTNVRLERILKSAEPSTKGSNGRWEMVRDSVPVMVLTDESHNRIRVVAPAADVKQVDQQVLMKMMEANFASALDARYAIFGSIVWATFIHPLDSLRERDLISALRQVTTLVKTTGTTFSSSELQFGPSYQEK